MNRLVEWVASARTDAGVRWLADDQRTWSYASYRSLATAVRRAAGFLRASGIGHGDVVALAPARVDAFVAGFFGAWYAGATPCPLPPPAAGASLPAYVARAGHILELARPAMVLADEGMHDPLARALAAAKMPKTPILTVATATDHPAETEPPVAPATGLLQFTSGTAARPRGIRIAPESLAANIEAIRRWIRLGTDEPTASWLPLHHDMGLVGCLLTPILNQSPLFLLRPDQFVRDPVRWLACFGSDGAAATATPAFGLDYTCDRFATARARGNVPADLDLSGWRVAIVGAERVDPGTLRRFAETFAPYGFDPAAFRPAYGLAEATLAVTGSDGPARLVHTGAAGGRAVSCGPPLSGVDVRILDDNGYPVRDGQVGEIAVSGPAVSTYQPLGMSTGTRLAGEQLRTGDAGFLVDGELVVLGRIGDSLKVRGRSVYAEDLEATLATETGLPAHRTAVLLGSVHGRATAVLVVEGEAASRDVSAALAILARETAGADVRSHSGPRGTIPRTASGKLRRRALWRRLLDNGWFGRSAGAGQADQAAEPREAG